MVEPRVIKPPQLTPTTGQTQEQANKYYTMLNSKPVNELSTLIGSNPIENKLNNTGVIKSEQLEVIFSDFDKKTSKLRVSTQKLLHAILLSFTNSNHIGRNERTINNSEVNISLKEYAKLCGYTDLKNARKKINQDLTVLYGISLTWKEVTKGKEKDYKDVRLLQEKGIERGYISVKLTDRLANYLIYRPLTQYPITLFKLDNRQKTAYQIGCKFAEHYSIDNNHIKGTANLLKINNILKVTNLPKIESVKNTRHSWQDRIKEPLEKNLDILTQEGILKDWYYSKSKGKILTDKEATKFASYEEWANTYIHFRLEDEPDHTKRIAEKNKERKEVKKNVSNKRQKR